MNITTLLRISFVLPAIGRAPLLCTTIRNLVRCNLYLEHSQLIYVSEWTHRQFTAASFTVPNLPGVATHLFPLVIDSGASCCRPPSSSESATQCAMIHATVQRSCIRSLLRASCHNSKFGRKVRAVPVTAAASHLAILVVYWVDAP